MALLRATVGLLIMTSIVYFTLLMHLNPYVSPIMAVSQNSRWHSYELVMMIGIVYCTLRMHDHILQLQAWCQSRPAPDFPFPHPCVRCEIDPLPRSDLRLHA